MKNRSYTSMLIFVIFSVGSIYSQSANEREISKTLDQWHAAAADSDYEGYFELMASGAHFLGTDAVEDWSKTDFQEFSKPYFDSGKGWKFQVVSRNVYLSKEGTIAWFDELLDTQMKLCRGSGVMIKNEGKWKIAHYVLSIAIPNENVEEITLLKTTYDDSLIDVLKNK